MKKWIKNQNTRRINVEVISSVVGSKWVWKFQRWGNDEKNSWPSLSCIIANEEWREKAADSMTDAMEVSPYALAMPRDSLLFCCLQYNTTDYNPFQHSTIQYNTIQYSTVQYSTVQYSTVQYSTVQYSTVRCTAAQSNEKRYWALIGKEAGKADRQPDRVSSEW